MTTKRKILRWLLRIVAVLLLAPLIALGGVAAYYGWVVSGTPGTLDTPVSAGEQGAMVNVFAGTGGIPYMSAYDTPAACVPFGMVRLGPDTASIIKNWTALNASGYYYGDNKILGFSHTRLVGADAREGGTFRILPALGVRADRQRAKGSYTRFSHRKEKGFPGYYAVELPQEGVLAELTATPHTGVHRYTFRKAGTPHLLLDVTSALGDGRCEMGKARVLPETREIEGSARCYGSFSGRYGGLELYFVARFSAPFAQYGTWSGATFAPGAAQAEGNRIGVDLAFAESAAANGLEVRLAISCVSVANARANLEAECKDLGFDTLAAAAKAAWEQRLTLIRAEGGTPAQRRIFYTALYHAFQMPTRFSDANGEYIGFDRAIHRAEGFQYYTDFSLWDSFRTVHPLYNLIARKDQRDMVVSLVEMAKAGGALPRWPAGCGYTNCMFGTPADIAVAEAYLKGVRDFDVEAAYASMLQLATQGPPQGCKFGGRNGLSDYLALGYCPSDKMNKAVSATLEYAWSDYSIALLAKALGHNADAAQFEKRGQNYRNTWNPGTQYFQPRDSQGKFGPFDPLALSYTDWDGKITAAYVEGSALQWRWGVPYDMEGLVSLFKSREYFIAELQDYLNQSNPRKGWWNPHSYYWHGNEPYVHAAYLFNAAGRPDLAQYWIDRIRETKYGDDPVGLDGNDDGGTLSAWYVWSALGIYPIAGTVRYELGTPMFDSARVNLGEKTLTIETKNHAPGNLYVWRVTLNGTPVDRTWVTHDEIANGGVLCFEMGAAPPAP